MPHKAFLVYDVYHPTRNEAEGVGHPVTLSLVMPNALSAISIEDG